MENGDLTSQIEYDGYNIVLDIVKSTWDCVAGLIAMLWEEGHIYSLDISNSGKSSEMLIHLIKELILEIQKTRPETSFMLDCKVSKEIPKVEIIKLANTLENFNFIDSHTSLSINSIRLICE